MVEKKPKAKKPKTKKVIKPKTKKPKKEIVDEKDDFIKMKKLLKEKTKAYLEKQAKKLTKDKQKKLVKRMTKKVSDSKTLAEVLRLIRSLGRSPVQSLPSQLSQGLTSQDLRERLFKAAQTDVKQTAKEVKEEIEKSSKTAKDAVNLAEKYNKLYEKYKNGETITTSELFSLFGDTAEFAIDNKEYLPSFSEVKQYANSTYGVLKYIGQFINQKIPLVKKDLPTAPRTPDTPDIDDEPDDQDPDDEGDDDDDEPKQPPPPPTPSPKPDDDDDEDDEPKPDDFGQAIPSSNNPLDPPVDSNYSNMPSLFSPMNALSMAALGGSIGMTAYNRYNRFIRNRQRENTRVANLAEMNDDIRNAVAMNRVAMNAAGNALSRIRDIGENSFAVEGREVGRSATLRNRQQQERIRLQYADRLERLKNAQRQPTTQEELDEAEELAKAEETPSKMEQVVVGTPTDIQVGTPQPPLMESDLVENPRTGRLVRKSYLQSLERREATQRLREGLRKAEEMDARIQEMKEGLEASQPSKEDLDPEMFEFDEPKS